MSESENYFVLKQRLADELLQFPETFMEEHKEDVEALLCDIDLDEEIRTNLSAYSALIIGFAEKIRNCDLTDADLSKAIQGLQSYLELASIEFCNRVQKEADEVSSQDDRLGDRIFAGEIEQSDMAEVMSGFFENSRRGITLQFVSTSFLILTVMMRISLNIIFVENRTDASETEEDVTDEKSVLTNMEKPEDEIIVDFGLPFEVVRMNKSGLLLFEQFMGKTYEELDEYLRA